MTRLPVRKMYKLFINGAFVRSESARSEAVDGENVARATRKDARDAVVAARTAHERWAAQAPQLRGQVLYRLAEMTEARTGELAGRLVEGRTVADRDAARREVEATVDRIVHYAGWCDKYAELASTRAPVSGSELVVTGPEPAGVVAVLAPDVPALLGLVTALVPPLVAGNAVVLVASAVDPRTAIVFAECLATCDLPAGAANVLTGPRAEIAPWLAGHADVDAFSAFGLGPDDARALGELAAETITRTHFEPAPEPERWADARYASLDRVLAFTETKAVWLPAQI